MRDTVFLATGRQLATIMDSPIDGLEVLPITANIVLRPTAGCCHLANLTA